MIKQQQEQRKRSADYQNQLVAQPIARVVESALAEQEHAYQDEIAALRARLEAGDAPGGIKTHLENAIRSLEDARQASLEPIKEEIAKAIVGIANQYRLPLQLRHNGPAPTGAKQLDATPASPKGRGGNQTFILRAVQAAGGDGIKPSEIRQKAEEQGYNSNSVGQAVNVLIRKGAIRKIEERRDAPVVSS
ncbi:MAG: hypothetical protein WD009_06575 [Phycisphaeraceae bacterium]